MNGRGRLGVEDLPRTSFLLEEGTVIYTEGRAATLFDGAARLQMDGYVANIPGRSADALKNRWKRIGNAPPALPADSVHEWGLS